MTVADPSPETTDTVAPEGGASGLPTSNTDAQATSSTATETGTDVKPTGEGEGTGDAPKHKSVLEAAKAALAKDKGADPSPADAKTEQPKPETGKVDEKAKPEGEKSEGESEVPAQFKDHPAWQRIAKARDGFKAERDEFKAGADKWTRFNELATSHFGAPEAAQAWMNRGVQLTKAGVTDQEQHIVTEFALAVKTDPNRAFAIIKPIYEALQGITGEVLSAELRSAVDAGEITEERAQQLNKAEADKRISDTRRAQADKTVKERSDAEAAQATGAAMVRAVEAWESRLAQSDPDWKRIGSLVNEQVTILREARQPKTPEDAVKLCDEAVAIVKKMGGAFAAPKPAVTPTGTNTSTRQQETRAKSAFEHVKRSFAA